MSYYTHRILQMLHAYAVVYYNRPRYWKNTSVVSKRRHVKNTREYQKASTDGESQYDNGALISINRRKFLVTYFGGR